MGKFYEFGTALRKNLQSILKEEFTQRQLNETISLCHSFALVLLRKKLSSGKLNLHLLHLDLHDIAYDCIAELFRMDGDYPLIQLRSYFSGIDIDRSSDQELIDALRRIAFSKVNQGIFRLYQEYDPSLSKILRNLKLAIQSLNSFTEYDRFGEMYIVPASMHEQFEKPVMNSDDLERFLGKVLHGNERIPEILAAVSLHLQQQEQFAKAVSLIGLGIAVRKIFAGQSLDAVSSNDEQSKETDALFLIGQSCTNIQGRMYSKYVGKRKLKVQEYNAMFEVIKKNLSAIIINQDGQDFSLYDHLREEIHPLTKAEYKDTYRPILEYLFGLTKKELGKLLKRELK
ncbi:MAG: hypothetical protein WCT99_04360 [Bacteroidota bacterium]|jgi:hypothetical protein